MSENEIGLMNIIQTQEHPEEALCVAIKVILDYLEQGESFVKPFPAGIRERV